MSQFFDMNYDLEQTYMQATRRISDQKPIIGITGNFGDKGCELAQAYYASVIEAGGVPLVIPPSTNLTILDDILRRVDGILLSGGADVNPLWQGEDPIPQLGTVCPERDESELLLVRRACDFQIPLLGICRGMQMMTVALGGKVYQDMAAARPGLPLIKHSQKAPRTLVTHQIETTPGSLMQALFGQQLYVNSFHHQAINDPGPRLRATAHAGDGIIEAIESTEYKCAIGVQWHPECLSDDGKHALFNYFVNEAGKYACARRWHAAHLTLDSHCDTPMFFDKNIDFNRRDPQILVDIHKMTEGSLDASIMVAYLAQGSRTPEGHDQAVEKANDILNRLSDMVQQCPQAEMAFTPTDMVTNKSKGKKSIFSGIENGYAFGTDLANIDHFRQRGVVYTTLCHNGNNEICDSARPSSFDLQHYPATHGAEHGGLSPFGREVIAEMNRCGMIVDLSHAAETSFYDALSISKVPIVCSHSSSRELCNHPRNLTDDQLKALAASGGVAQCTFYSGFLRKDSENATINDAMSHLLHMIAVAGVEHVGIGTDFDGDGGVPGLADASQLIRLTMRLQAEGFDDEDLAKIWGGNFLRVMSQVQAYSK